MDEVLLKQLVRQVKILNFWVSFFGVLFIVTFVISGLLLWKVATYLHSAQQSITNLESKTSQSLDVQKQVCSTDSLKALVGSSTYCQ